jgi:ribosome-associated toxin RatA of RatAB toxin-antitoxin module
MHSAISIEIAASPEIVFRLARDVTHWERLLPHYVRSRAVGRAGDGAVVVDFIARRVMVRTLGIGLPVIWRARTWSDAATRRLHFVHVAGATKGMAVTWHIEPRAEGGTQVTIEHAFAPRLPGFARFVDRAFTRPIAGRTLDTFKALAEAIAGSGTEPPDA